MNETADSQRLDKWLWHARVTKTRSLAQKTIAGGKVRVDRERVSSASFKVRIGHVLTVTLDRQIKVLKIAGFAEKRGPYETARLLYEDLSPAAEAKTGIARQKMAKGGLVSIGKPSREDRRAAIRLKQGVE